MIPILNPDLIRLIDSYSSRDTHIDWACIEPIAFCRFPDCEWESFFVFLTFYYKGNVAIVKDKQKRVLTSLIDRLCKTGNVIALQAFVKEYKEDQSFIDLSQTFFDLSKLGHLNMIRFLLTRPSSFLPGTEFRPEAERTMCLHFLAQHGHSALFIDFFDPQKVGFLSDVDAYYHAATRSGNLDIVKHLFSIVKPRFPNFLYRIAANRGHVHILRFLDSVLTFEPTQRTSPWNGTSKKFHTLFHPSEITFPRDVAEIHLRAYEIAIRKGKVNVLVYIEERIPFLCTCDFSLVQLIPFIQVCKRFENKILVEEVFNECLRRNFLADALYICRNHKLPFDKNRRNEEFLLHQDRILRVNSLVNYYAPFLEKKTIRSVIKSRVYLEDFKGFVVLANRFPDPEMMNWILTFVHSRKIRTYILLKFGLPPESQPNYAKEFQDAANDGNLKRLKCLYEQYGDQISQKKKEICGEPEGTIRGDKPLLEKVAEEGFLYVVDFLLQIFTFCDNEKMDIVKGAMDGNKLSIIKYIIKVLKPKYLEKAFYYSIQVGSFPIVKFLCESGSISHDIIRKNPKTTEWMNSVDIIDYLDQHKWLDANQFLDVFLECALSNDNLDLLAYVWKKGGSSKQFGKIFLDHLSRHHPDLDLIHFVIEKWKEVGWTKIELQQILSGHLDAKRLEEREAFLLVRSKMILL